eukprot:2205411-Amphidinium_carterae.1
MCYIALTEHYPGPESWFWPFPPEGFATDWMATSSVHVVLVEPDGAMMLVLSRLQTRRQLADGQRVLRMVNRGGHPVLSDEELGRILNAPQRVRLFAAHVLLVPRAVYDAALHIPMTMLARVLQLTISLEVRGDMIVFFGQGPILQRWSPRTFWIPRLEGARVLIMDVVIRASRGLGLTLHCFGLSGHWQDPDFMPPRTFSTRWATQATSFVALVDATYQEVYILIGPHRSVLMNRGGARVETSDAIRAVRGTVGFDRELHVTDAVFKFHWPNLGREHYVTDAVLKFHWTNSGREQYVTDAEFKFHWPNPGREQCGTDAVFKFHWPKLGSEQYMMDAVFKFSWSTGSQSFGSGGADHVLYGTSNEFKFSLGALSVKYVTSNEFMLSSRVASIQYVPGNEFKFRLCSGPFYETNNVSKLCGSAKLESGAARGGARSLKRPAASQTVDEAPPKRERKKRVLLYLNRPLLPERLFVTFAHDQILKLLPLHWALHPAWLTAKGSDWVWHARSRLPSFDERTWNDWLNFALDVLRTKDHVFFGFRATRQIGISVATEMQQGLVRRLNLWLSSWLPPQFSWNAVGVIRHKSMPAHTD